MIKQITLGAVMVVILGLGTSNATPASSIPILLTIDVSNPAAVIISATTSNSYADFAGNNGNDGVDLESFFTVDQPTVPTGQFSGGSLQADGVGAAYDSVLADDYSTGGGLYYDLELYIASGHTGAGNAETFSTTQQAFTGTWTINLSSLGISASDLPTPGASGSIISGYNGDGPNTAFIGQWEIQPVPEPTSGGLLILGTALAGMAVWRRRASCQ